VSGETILHLTPSAWFESLPAEADYLPEGFDRDGFIHCTREPEVLLEVANAFYRQTPGEMLVLVIDPARVQAEVRFEAAALRPRVPDDPLFPHIYGPLNRDAIVAVRPARRAADGTYLAV
jgi:uncharacterized protein (DUF952 family)